MSRFSRVFAALGVCLSLAASSPAQGPAVISVDAADTGPRVNPRTWHAMIYFDGTRAFGTASYHLWKLLGQNRPEQMVAATTEYPEAGPSVIAGQVGVGAWDASAEFKDIRVERDGEVLFSGDEPDADGGQRDRGRWTVEDGVYRQGRRGFGMRYFGDPAWSDYTLTFKARKLSGGEGFLIVFGRQGEDRLWWNLGGWGNRQHAIEQNQTPVGRPARGTIENDRWHDVKIQLDGNRIRCFSDGELVHDVEAERQETFFTNAGRMADGSLVIKAIILADEPQAATLKLEGAGSLAREAEVNLLPSDSLSDNNSLQNPSSVVPRTERIKTEAQGFRHDFPPRSLTIVRLAPGS